MGAWYTIGLALGLGVAFGLAAAGALRRPLLAVPVALVAAVVVGFLIGGWAESGAGAVGALCGAFAAAPFVAGALRRGGTPGGTAVLVGGASLVCAALALVPVVGYLEAVALPVFALRLRRRTPETHAGLRTLARD